MRYPGFLPGVSYKSSSYMADAEELINLYFERTESPNAPSPGALLPTPGFALDFTVPEGPGRGSVSAGSLEFFVEGFRLYERNAGVVTARATIASDANPATLSWNGPSGGELFITSGDLGYCYNIVTHALTVVLSSGATMGSYLDGFFLCIDAATGTFRISDLLDGLTWDPTQIVIRSAAPDPWIAMTVTNVEIDLMGSRTRETWFNAGSFPFPFEPIPGALREQGIAAPFSLPRDVSPVVWVGANAQGARMVWMRQGYDGVRISTHGIEAQMQAYATVADALSFSFQEGGHTFIALIFPTADRAFLYDVTSGVWTKWLYWNHLTSDWEAVRVRTHLFTSSGVHLVQDRSSGAVYRMGLDLFEDVDESVILRERTPPRLSAPDNVRFITDEIQLIMDVGVGLIGSDDDDPDVNPMAMLVTSRDGGRTWGPERHAALGKIGEYSTRVYWTNGGQARNRVDRFRFAARCPIRIADATVTIRVGTS